MRSSGRSKSKSARDKGWAIARPHVTGVPSSSARRPIVGGMTTPMNLNKTRKERAKAEANSKAAMNRIALGRTKAEKKLEAAAQGEGRQGPWTPPSANREPGPEEALGLAQRPRPPRWLWSRSSGPPSKNWRSTGASLAALVVEPRRRAAAKALDPSLPCGRAGMGPCGTSYPDDVEAHRHRRPGARRRAPRRGRVHLDLDGRGNAAGGTARTAASAIPTPILAAPVSGMLGGQALAGPLDPDRAGLRRLLARAPGRRQP